MKGRMGAQRNGHSKSSKSSQSKSKHSPPDKKYSPKAKESKNTRNSQKSLQKISKNTPKTKEKKKSEGAQIADQQEKKNFLPGQKYKTPDEQSGALAFYKSLYEQNPRSQMARRYCIEYGVLEYNQAKKVFQSLSKMKSTK